MAFCLAILFGLIGFVLINQDTSGTVTKEYKQKARAELIHGYNPFLEYYLVWGVYAYYAHQPKSARPNPYQDAIRHARIEVMRRGYLTTNGLYYRFDQITPEVWDQLNLMGHYTASVPDGSVRCGPPVHMTSSTEKDWPFKNTRGAGNVNALLGPHKVYWARQTSSSSEVILYQERYMFNRLAEWFYLVMFKDEYLALNLDIHNVLLDESTIPKKYQRSISSIDRAWEELLSEIQGVVYWGDKWDEEIRGYQRLEAQHQAQVQRAKEEAEAASPAEQRRYGMLHGAGAYERDHAQQSAETMVETSEWARQQLKEKYDIDY